MLFSELRESCHKIQYNPCHSFIDFNTRDLRKANAKVGKVHNTANRYVKAKSLFNKQDISRERHEQDRIKVRIINTCKLFADLYRKNMKSKNDKCAKIRGCTILPQSATSWTSKSKIRSSMNFSKAMRKSITQIPFVCLDREKYFHGKRFSNEAKFPTSILFCFSAHYHPDNLEKHCKAVYANKRHYEIVVIISRTSFKFNETYFSLTCTFSKTR